MHSIFSFLFKKRFYLFIFRERRREGERGENKHQCVVASRVPSTGDMARNPGMCPDWESNQRPFALQCGAQSTEPHQPGLHSIFSYTQIRRQAKAKGGPPSGPGD